MTDVQATAEIFLMALKSLPKRERDAVLARIARESPPILLGIFAPSPTALH